MGNNTTKRPQIVNALNALNEATSVIIQDLKSELLDKENYKRWEDKQIVLIDKVFSFAKDVSVDSIDELEILNRMFFYQKLDGTSFPPVLMFHGCLTGLDEEKREMIRLTYKDYQDSLFNVYHETLYPLQNDLIKED